MKPSKIRPPPQQQKRGHDSHQRTRPIVDLGSIPLSAAPSERSRVRSTHAEFEGTSTSRHAPAPRLVNQSLLVPLPSHQGFPTHLSSNNSHPAWQDEIEQPLAPVGHPSRSTHANNSHPTPPLYPVRLATETSLARNELSGSSKDKGSLRELSEGHEPMSFASSHIINVKFLVQDQASRRRLVPIHKGKHKDVVGQHGSGRSSSVTGGGNGVSRITSAHVQPFLRLEGFSRTIETLYLHDVLWQPLVLLGTYIAGQLDLMRRQDATLGAVFVTVDHDNIPGNATQWIAAWLTIRPRTDTFTSISINHFHPPPEFFSATQDQEWDEFTAGGPSLIFEILLGLRHCHFRATREETVMTASEWTLWVKDVTCALDRVVDILQDQERSRRMMARLYVRLDVRTNPPSVTTHVTRPSASDIKSAHFDPNSTILDGQNVVNNEPSSSISRLPTPSNLLLELDLPVSGSGSSIYPVDQEANTSYHQPQEASRKRVMSPLQQDSKRAKIEDERDETQ